MNVILALPSKNSVTTVRGLKRDKGVYHAETVLGQCKAL